jgi:restriction system protein
MEPNESTQGRTGEKISFSGDYRAACCQAVKKVSQGHSFSECSEHGETVWSWIPPFVRSAYGTESLLAQWRREAIHRLSISETVTAKASVSASANVEAFGPIAEQKYPDILLQAIILPGTRTIEGDIIEAVGPAWFAILRELERDPNILYWFNEHPREFEELMAAAYKKDGWDEVTLTPRSNDKGRDIIAAKHGSWRVKIFDQAKAYAPSRRVTADDVRAMVGVLTLEPNVSKGIVTTTSQFAPGIEKDENIKRFMPYRLELRNGQNLCEWLSKLYKTNS